MALQRFQIYLEEEQVDLLEDIAEDEKTSRSAIIREMISKELKKIEPRLQKRKTKKNPLDNLIGAFDLGPKGSDPDEIDKAVYLDD